MEGRRGLGEGGAGAVGRGAVGDVPVAGLDIVVVVGVGGGDTRLHEGFSR